ncbi:hypothetical protein PsYK624_058550 [Phanerochaete sordida]|uniref:Uncharacterized protein n=1 Tax=Phanerochaete sordida TaxID=48140 RepID=A0A9P3G9A4_9APHY|nr:hypothetical protein PsYK624_058550 [Phanerochaete sordida]
MYPASHPINAGGVPAGFTVLQPNPDLLQSDETAVPPGPICASTTSYKTVDVGASGSDVIGASYTFSCNASRGAVAVLGSHGHQEWYLPNSKFLEYIVKHHASWHDFAVEKTHLISSDSLVLVSGWLKASEWALATFSNQSRAHAFSLNADAGSIASARFTASSGTQVHMPIHQRCGPVRPVKPSGPLPCDQCLFVRYYKIRRRAFIYESLLGVKVVESEDAADMHDTSRGQSHSGLRRSRALNAMGSRSKSISEMSARKGGLSDALAKDMAELEVEEMPPAGSEVVTRDPIDAVLDYILETAPAAEIAVACFEDTQAAYFRPALPSLDNRPGFSVTQSSNAAHSTAPRIHINAHGVAYISASTENTDEGSRVSPNQRGSVLPRVTAEDEGSPSPHVYPRTPAVHARFPMTGKRIHWEDDSDSDAWDGSDEDNDEENDEDMGMDMEIMLRQLGLMQRHRAGRSTLPIKYSENSRKVEESTTPTGEKMREIWARRDTNQGQTQAGPDTGKGTELGPGPSHLHERRAAAGKSTIPTIRSEIPGTVGWRKTRAEEKAKKREMAQRDIVEAAETEGGAVGPGTVGYWPEVEGQTQLEVDSQQ